MRRLIVAGGVALGGALILVLWAPSMEASPDNGDRHPSDSSRSLTAMQNDLARTQVELRSLRAELRRSAVGVADPAESECEAAQASAAEPPPEPRADPIEDAEAAQQQFIEQNSQRLDHLLGQQGADPSWSLDTERDIERVLTSELAQGTSLVSAECGTSLCRVQMKHDDKRAQSRLLRQLSLTPPFDTEGLVHEIGDPDAPESIVYIARRDTTLF